MEEKILSMYAKKVTTGDIESHMRELYNIGISDSTISRITYKILPIVKEWQEHPLEEVYAVFRSRLYLSSFCMTSFAVTSANAEINLYFLIVKLHS